MKEQVTQELSLAEQEKALDRELAEISPYLDRGFSLATPSQAVLDRIHQEAVRQTMRKKSFRLRIKILSAAASLAILAGGVFHFVHFEAPQDSQGALFMGTPEDFLDLQSLDADSCFYGEAEIWEKTSED